jgi:hypothetical protein
MVKQACEHRVAVIASRRAPVAAERGERLCAKAGRPVVSQKEQPSRLGLIDQATQERLRIAGTIHPPQGSRKGKPPAATLQRAQADERQSQVGQLTSGQPDVVVAENRPQMPDSAGMAEGQTPFQETVTVGFTERQQARSAVVVAEQTKGLGTAACQGLGDRVLPARGVRQVTCPQEQATSRGPDGPVGTPGDRGAHVDSPQPGQARPCRWYSTTCGLISGSSHTWWRSGAASSPDSSLPQRRQAVGFKGITSSHCSVGRSGRSCLGWPG